MPQDATPTKGTVNSDTLISLSIDKHLETNIEMDGIVLVGLLVVLLIGVLWKLSAIRRFKELEIDEAELGIGKSKIKIKPNLVDKQIAYKIWVELSTRKIGIPIELEKDVIFEVYDSWYTFFSVTRELVKDVPVNKISRKNTEKVVSLSIRVLNHGIRPHLTTWQAKFRRWYDQALLHPNNKDLSPQEIQRNYPAYSELTMDLEAVNKRLIFYRTQMESLFSA